VNARPSDYWTPKNYDGGGGGIITLRSALEHSKNLVTARLLDGAFASGPEQSLKQVCDLAIEAQLYLECTPHYPFVLGAQPVRLIDLAAFYAAIANEGALPSPYAIESIEDDGRVVYAHKATPPVALGSADKAAFFQLKSMLQGVLARGTANSLKQLAPYVAGKTGTSDDENDAWFVSFTNDVTVAVWTGYDNAGGKRRTLGRGKTGAKVAIPIAKPILEASWEYQAPKAPLSPPSREAARQLIALPIDLTTGDRLTEGQKGFTEYFRLNRWGQLTETQFRLVPEQDAYAFRRQDPWSDGDSAGNWPYDSGQVGPYARSPDWFEAPQSPPPYAGDPWFEERPRHRPRRIDPDYFWGRGSIY
jgi:membrane carboxypeptidase/penicillin-binding protein